MINGEIVGGYPPSTVDIIADKKLLNKFVDNLFQHQTYLVDRDVKHLLFASILRWEDQFEQVASKNPLQKNSNTIKHIFIASLQKVKNENGITDMIWKSWKKQVSKGYYEKNFHSIPLNKLSRIMNHDDFKDERILVDGRNTYETMKHIATSNNQIAYSNFEINTKINNIANEVMDIKKDISVIKSLLLGELGNPNESIEGSHKSKKMKHENFDWNMIETKFDEANLKQFLLLWYDYNALASYNKVEEKNKGIKNKFMRIHKAIKYLLTFEEETDFSKEKPETVEHYSEWRANMRSMSEYCALEAFKVFQDNNVLPEKFKNIEDMKLTSFLTAMKKMKQKENNICE